MEDIKDIKEIDKFIAQQKLEDLENSDLEYSEFIGADYNETQEEAEIVDYDIPDFIKVNTKIPAFTFTDAEKKVINSCKDVQLKDLLILNRQKNVQLMQCFKKIKNLLLECQKNITNKEKHIESRRGRKSFQIRIWKTGAPYFKTADYFPCPRNEDTIKKHHNNELVFYDMIRPPKWTGANIVRLMRGIAFQYKILRENQLQKQIREKEKEIALGEHVDKKHLESLKDQLNKITTDSEVVYPPLDFNKKINWSRIAEAFLNDRYSFQDCEIFWSIYLHPTIKKNDWSVKEKQQLTSLVSKYQCQNWDAIATELDSGRTGFVACMQYFRYINPANTSRFSKEEDEKLCKLVEEFKKGNIVPWTKIVFYFKNRTRSQLYYRYKYFLSCKNDIVRNRFSAAEDALLMILIDRFGKKFTKIAEYFPNRSAIQIKSRCNSYMKTVKKGAYSIEEDIKIYDFAKEHGTASFEALAKTMQRTNAQIRQRYRTLTTFLRENVESSISEVPRYRQQNCALGPNYRFLRCIADRFKEADEIPTIQQLESMLENKPDKPSDSSIDELLINFFSNAMALEIQKTCSQTNILQATKAIRTVLSILQAELHIPINYHQIPDLDQIDIQILKVLTSYCPSTSTGAFIIRRKGLKVESLIPPNLCTAIGMRSVLIKNEIYKSANKESVVQDSTNKECKMQNVKWCIENHLSDRPEHIRYALITERSLFFQRFVSIFKIPAILTLQSPSADQLASSKERPVAVYKRSNRQKEIKQSGSQVKTEQSSMSELMKRRICETFLELGAKSKKKRYNATVKPIQQPTKQILKKQPAAIVDDRSQNTEDPIQPNHPEFNFGKGELVVLDSPKKSSVKKEDLDDLDTLNRLLKMEQAASPDTIDIE